MTSRDQVSVALPPEVRVHVQRLAEREMISRAAVIRRLVAEDVRRAERQERTA